MDSVAVQASVPTFERSHRAFHRERTVTSTPCAGSFLPELPAILLSGFFPQIVYTPLPELTNFTVEPSRTPLGTAGRRGIPMNQMRRSDCLLGANFT